VVSTTPESVAKLGYPTVHAEKCPLHAQTKYKMTVVSSTDHEMYTVRQGAKKQQLTLMEMLRK
jgi:hypothetical protein